MALPASGDDDDRYVEFGVMSATRSMAPLEMRIEADLAPAPK
jgi:hypothetical protein